MHTRSHGPLPDPPVRLQTPRLRVEPPRLGIHDGRLHCGALPTELLENGKQLRLVATSLQESTLPGAGRGIIVQEDVAPGQLFEEFGGEVITFDEAKMRRSQVSLISQLTLSFIVSQFVFASQFAFVSSCDNTPTASVQGNHHIIRNGTFYIDSKPTLNRPALWFGQRHLLAGFANTLPRDYCNSKFVRVGDRIVLESTMQLRAGMEVFAFYERTD